jgi:lipoprotein NlpI
LHSSKLILCIYTITYFCSSIGHCQDAATSQSKKITSLLQQVSIAQTARQFPQAIKLLDQIEKLDDAIAVVFYLRGRIHFQQAAFQKSVRDFNRYVVLDPKIESRQWERGISMYYTQQYKQGATQFELYQTYHSQDVENSVWRFLCMVPDSGVAKARKVMLSIENDRRIPMMKVFEMYRGTVTPAEVLQAVEQGDPTKEVKATRAFYAHLYLGLYYEVTDKPKLARKYIQLAANPQLLGHAGINSYMWDVARVHWDRMQQKNLTNP